MNWYIEHAHEMNLLCFSYLTWSKSDSDGRIVSFDQLARVTAAAP